MTPTRKDTQPEIDRQAAQISFRAFVQEQVCQAIRATFITILEEEVSQFIGAAPYERTVQRRDQRAGYRSRTLGTTVGQIDDLPIPRTRGGFRTQLFERYQRRMTEVDDLLRDMFVCRRCQPTDGRYGGRACDWHAGQPVHSVASVPYTRS